MNRIDADLDTSGLKCPLPVLKARKCLIAMAPGTVLRLVATDPASWLDVPHFCAQAGHTLLDARQDGDRRIYLIRRADPDRT